MLYAQQVPSESVGAEPTGRHSIDFCDAGWSTLKYPPGTFGRTPRGAATFKIKVRCWGQFLLFAFCFLLLKQMPLPPLDSRCNADAHHRRPNAGAVVGVARQDAEPAVPGHGWPVTACPHNSAGVRVPGEPRRARPYGRAQTFWFLLGRLPKGTRRKGETRKKP